MSMTLNDLQIDIGTEHCGEVFNVQNIARTLCLFTKDNEPASTIVYLSVEQAEQLAVAAVEFLNAETKSTYGLVKATTVEDVKIEVLV